jgi:hypothetical protein
MRAHQLHVRLSDLELARVERVAAERGLDRQDAIRQLVKEASDALPLNARERD